MRKIVSILILGFILEDNFNLNLSIYLLIPISITLFFLYLSDGYSFWHIRSVVLLLSGLALSTIYYHARMDMRRVDGLDSIYGEKKYIEGVMIEDQLIKVSFLDQDGESVSCKAVISFNSKAEEVVNPKEGDHVNMFATIDSIKNFNSHFDYKRFMNRKGIFVKLRPKEFYIDQSEPSIFQKVREKSKSYVMRSLKEAGIENIDHIAILASLLLGDRQLLSKSINNQFIAAGNVHILAVSGLHVGFIILILSIPYRCLIYLLRRSVIYINRVDYSKKAISVKRIFETVNCSLIIISLAIYVVITGAPISVVRSVVCYILYALGVFVGRKDIKIIDIVVASIYINLMISPEQLFSVSFQLSYGAVISIIIISNALKLEIKNKILSYLYSLFTVSLSAQIGTAIFSLYHFGTLSLVSILSSMISVPLTALIIVLAIFIISVGGSSWILSWIVHIISFCFNFLLSSTKLFSNLSYGHIEDIEISNSIFIISILLLVSVLNVIVTKEYLDVKRCGMLMLILIITVNIEYIIQYLI